MLQNTTIEEEIEPIRTEIEEEIEPSLKQTIEENIELIRRAKAGDEEAKNMLFKKYERLAYFALPWEQRLDEDKRQDALYHMWRAVLKYDESRGNKLSTAIYNYVRTAVAKDFETQNAQKRKQPNTVYLSDKDFTLERTIGETISQEHMWNTYEIEGRDQFREVENKHFLITLIQRTGLSGRNDQVLYSFLMGLSNQEITYCLGITPQTATGAFKWARNKLISQYQQEKKRHALKYSANQ